MPSQESKTEMEADVTHHKMQTFIRRNYGLDLVFEGAQPIPERERRLLAFLARNGLTG